MLPQQPPAQLVLTDSLTTTVHVQSPVLLLMHLVQPSTNAPVQLPHTRLMEHAQVAMQTATLAPSLVAPAVINSTSLVELSASHAPTIV